MLTKKSWTAEYAIFIFLPKSNGLITHDDSNMIVCWFVLYSAEVIAVFKQFGFSVHGYADDLQLYDHVAPSESMSLVSRLSDCVEAVKARMASSRLRLNSSKTMFSSDRRGHWI